MSEEARIAHLYAEATLKVLIRAGVVAPSDIAEVADEVEGRAAGSFDPEPFLAAAHALRLTAIDFDPPLSAAEFRRSQIKPV